VLEILDIQVVTSYL